jgi:peptide/nickel transport system substrate-binding protein
MLRKVMYLAVTVLIATLVVGCGGAATEAAPTPTAAIVNPPVIKEATATPKPAATAAPTATPVPPTEVVVEKAVVNGVTMDFGRNEVIINNQVDFSIFDSFNPMIPNGWHYQNGSQQIQVEFLWYVNYATGELIPRLGESWEYNDDYTQLTLNLRKGVKWNDGEPFTSKDIVWTLQMAMDPKYDDLGGLRHGDAEYWSDVSAPDDFTVVITMTEPRPRQHQIFWCKIVGGAVIYPEHIWANNDPYTFKNNPPVWTGPYELYKVYPENKVFVWVRDEDYWGKSIGLFPDAKYTIWRTGPGAEQALAEMKEGMPDIGGVGYDVWVANQADLPHVNQVTYVDPCPRAAWFNELNEHLEKPEFRRAMSMLMNRQKWGDNIWSPPSKPAQGLWADYRNLDKYINQEAKDTWGTLEYNPEKALELLESIGYSQVDGKLLGPDGTQVKLAVTTPVGVGGWEYLMGQDFTEEIKLFGIDATFEYVEGVFWDSVDRGEYDIGFWWFCGATVDPVELYGGFLCDYAVPKGEVSQKGNDQRHCNEEFDATVLALQAIDPDHADAMALYNKLFDLWMQDPPGVPLIETYYSVSYNTMYWDNMMSNDNLYTVPFNWWGQIIEVYFNAKTK